MDAFKNLLTPAQDYCELLKPGNAHWKTDNCEGCPEAYTDELLRQSDEMISAGAGLMTWLELQNSRLEPQAYLRAVAGEDYHPRFLMECSAPSPVNRAITS
jgi:hypothetical protein